MGNFDRRTYIPPRVPESMSRLEPVDAGSVTKSIVAVAVVGVVVFAGYKLMKTAGATSAAESSSYQVQELSQRIGELEQQIKLMEKERKGYRAAARPAAVGVIQP